MNESEELMNDRSDASDEEPMLSMEKGSHGVNSENITIYFGLSIS
jgi:hypothetical protein